MRIPAQGWGSRVVRLVVSSAAALALLCAAAPSMATVTITDCASDAHCQITGKRTTIDVPSDTVVLAGAIAPKAGTDMIRVRAQAIVVDGPSGGSVTADGKGKAIELDADGTVVVTGDLLSSNSNGNIVVHAVQMVKIQGPVDVESNGDIDIECTGANCPIVLTNAHFKSNRYLVNADGNIIWDGNFVELFSPRDLFKMKAANGSIKKSSAMNAALVAGHLRLDNSRGVDAVSEAQAFCESCQGIGTPSPTATPPRTSTDHRAAQETATPNGGTPTPTAGTPTPTSTTHSLTVARTAGHRRTAGRRRRRSIPRRCRSGRRSRTPSPTQTPALTATQTPPATTTATPQQTQTVTRTATPALTPTPNGTPTPANCNEVIGGVESTLFIEALGDIDLSCTSLLVSENISIKATGNIDLTNATLDNTSGKCGEITIDSGGQINIQGATIIDDDCPHPGDVSEMNGREQVPHTGFANVVGTPSSTTEPCDERR